MGTILQRLDAEIATFTDSFTNLVKASRVENLDEKTLQVMQPTCDLRDCCGQHRDAIRLEL